MEALNLQQGTAAWAEHRATALNASDAPAMMGYSPYRSRQDLIRERATGIVDADINPAQAKRFADGHRFEALARPLAEEIVGEELFPVVGKSGKYSASYDGLTLLEDTAFEHKTLGEALRYTPWDEGNGDHLPLHYRIQMEHQCMVCPTIERILFMASRWTDNGELLEERRCWYAPDPELRARIVAGWEQFEDDVTAYVPEDHPAPVTAAPIESLPAVVVQVQGALTVAGNLPAFGEALRAFIERIPAKPATDQQFADAEAACKALKKAEDALDQAEDGALAQISDVELMRRTVADLKALARSTRLATEKLVKAEKDARRTEKVMAARTDTHPPTSSMSARSCSSATRIRRSASFRPSRRTASRSALWIGAYRSTRAVAGLPALWRAVRGDLARIWFVVAAPLLAVPLLWSQAWTAGVDGYNMPASARWR